jgi:hypothetical protein
MARETIIALTANLQPIQRGAPLAWEGRGHVQNVQWTCDLGDHSGEEQRIVEWEIACPVDILDMRTRIHLLLRVMGRIRRATTCRHPQKGGSQTVKSTISGPEAANPREMGTFCACREPIWTGFERGKPPNKSRQNVENPNNQTEQWR